MSNRRGTTFRLTPDIRAELDAYAARTSRSANGALNYLLRLALNAEHGGADQRNCQVSDCTCSGCDRAEPGE